ncbi:hypothetical protein, partial [Burkholderia vietnamiensis]
MAGDRHKDAILSRRGARTDKKRPHAAGMRRFWGKRATARATVAPVGGRQAARSERQIDVRLRGRQHAAEIRLDTLEPFL